MSTPTAIPVGFRCTRCYQQTLAIAEDAGQSVPCISCQTLNEVPQADEQNIRTGQELLETMQAQPCVPAEATNDSYGEAINRYVEPATWTNEVPGESGSVTLASKTSRLLGKIIDVSATIGLSFIGVVIAMKYFPSSKSALVAVHFPVLALAICQWGLTAMEGKTIGKLIMRTKVINAEGNAPGFVSGVVLRSWCIALLGCIPIVGFFVWVGDPLSINWSPVNQCWHDKMAKTLVIQE